MLTQFENSKQTQRGITGKQNKLIVSSYSNALAEALNGVPFDKLVKDTTLLAKQGKLIEIIRTDNSIKIKITNNDKISTMSGKWNDNFEPEGDLNIEYEPIDIS